MARQDVAGQDPAGTAQTVSGNKTICVTDSGLGGLSVCAHLVRALKRSCKGARIVYFNACYDDDLGYNAIARREDKIRMFDRALAGMAAFCRPDEILVACNTLSVLLGETDFAAKAGTAVYSIVDTAVEEVLRQATPSEPVTVFGTETTIGENTYRDRLAAAGWPRSLIRQIPCPGLQSRISNDDRVAQTVETFTRQADKASWYLLACTHFGIRADAFSHSRIIDPNRAMAEAACGRVTGTGPVAMAMASRYRIAPQAVSTWSRLLAEPSTITMLNDHEVRPDLF